MLRESHRDVARHGYPPAGKDAAAKPARLEVVGTRGDERLRKPKGYWQSGGMGEHRFRVMLAKHNGKVSRAMREMQIPSATAYIMARRIRGVVTRVRHWDSAYEKSKQKVLRHNDAQEIEFEGSPILARYGPAGGYASVPSHRSRSGGMK